MTALLGPTRERLAKAAGFDVPAVDQKSRRQAFRLVDVIETMKRDGRLRDEQVNAFRQFEKDFTNSQRSSVLLCRYGEQASGGGTPLSQLAYDILCPEERRAEAFGKARDAAVTVGEPRTVEALLMIVTEACNLERIGREVLMVMNKSQAIAVAARTVQMGTYMLALHYGYMQPPTRASPS